MQIDMHRFASSSLQIVTVLSRFVLNLRMEMDKLRVQVVISMNAKS